VKDLERELDGLKQRYSRSLQEAQDMKSELETARKLAQEFEGKKEKELERLRTHLVQVSNISNPTMRTGLDFKSAQFDQV
jgi:predicted RNase H-like nuclease (RuvC/YqgF family)